jgi:hypothetical protein
LLQFQPAYGATAFKAEGSAGTLAFALPRQISMSSSKHMEPNTEHRILDEATVRRLYLEEQLSIRAIATLARVSTRVVYDVMSRYRIPRRRRGYRSEPRPNIDLKAGPIAEGTLRHLYTDEQRSIAAIAAMLQSSPSRIRNALVRWGIPRRRRGRPGSQIAH